MWEAAVEVDAVPVLEVFVVLGIVWVVRMSWSYNANKGEDYDNDELQTMTMTTTGGKTVSNKINNNRSIFTRAECEYAVQRYIPGRTGLVRAAFHDGVTRHTRGI